MGKINPDVVKPFEDLRINCIQQTKKEKDTITETDVKVYLYLLHYPGQPVPVIASAFGKSNIDSYESLKWDELVRRSLKRLRKAKFVRKEGQGKKVLWYADESVVTETFKSYYEDSPDKPPYPVRIEKSFLEFLKVLQDLSRQDVPSSVSVRNNIRFRPEDCFQDYHGDPYNIRAKPASDEADNIRVIVQNQNREEEINTIKKLVNRISPLQIHRHLLSMLKYTKELIEIQIGSDGLFDVEFDSTIEQLEKLAKKFGTSNISDIKRQLNEYKRTNKENNNKTKKFDKAIEFVHLDNPAHMIKIIDNLIHAFELYIKEYEFLAARLRK